MHYRSLKLLGGLTPACLFFLACSVRADVPPAPTQKKALYAILYAPGPSWRKGRPMAEQGLRPHALYYKGLLVAGRLHAAGQLGHEDGLAVIWAANDAEAQATLRKDPAIEAGIFVGQVRLWQPRFKSREPLPTQ